MKAAAVLDDGMAGGWSIGGVMYGRRCRGRGLLWPKIPVVGTLRPGHFAIVMLGTPTRGTSLTVIWNNRYSIWNALRFQLANGPVVFTA